MRPYLPGGIQKGRPSFLFSMCWKLQPDRGIDTASHAKHGVDFPHRWPGARAGIFAFRPTSSRGWKR